MLWACVFVMYVWMDWCIHWVVSSSLVVFRFLFFCSCGVAEALLSGSGPPCCWLVRTSPATAAWTSSSRVMCQHKNIICSFSTQPRFNIDIHVPSPLHARMPRIERSTSHRDKGLYSPRFPRNTTRGLLGCVKYVFLPAVHPGVFFMISRSWSNNLHFNRSALHRGLHGEPRKPTTHATTDVYNTPSSKRTQRAHGPGSSNHARNEQSSQPASRT